MASADNPRLVRAAFPTLTRGCPGCASCATVAAMACSCGAESPAFTARRDAALGMGEEFLDAHSGPGHEVIVGISSARPYECQFCAGHILATEHSVECIDFWNHRASRRRTGNDGDWLRRRTIGN